MDDLLDLDFASSAPPAQPKPTPQARYGGGRSAFDYLAQTSGAAVQSAPARTPTPQAQRAPTPRTQQQGGDAFSSLFGTSAAPAHSSNAPALSMAERLHHDSAARIGGLGSAGGLGAFGGLAPAGAGGAGSRARVASPSSSILTPTSRTASPAAASLAPSAAKKPADVWDFDLLSTAVPSKSPSPAPLASAPTDDPFDLGFDAPLSVSPAPTKSTPSAAPPADDFDLLDAFAAPASRASPAPSPAPPAARSSVSSPSPSSSPPPHILGHLVEMGFAPSSASAALAASRGPNGEWDLDAALEALMRAQEDEEKRRERDEWGDEDDIKVGRRRSWEREDDDDAADARELEARRRAAAARERDAALRRPAGDAPEAAGARTRPGAEAAAAAQDPVLAAREQARVLQEQASEVLAQAQKIGFSMFKSANAYLSEGKKALAKKLDEQRAAAAVTGGAAGRGAGSSAGAGAGAHNGRPKWWTEEMHREADGDAPAVKGKGRAAGEAAPPSSFRDDDDEVAPAEPFARGPPPQARRAEPAAAPPASEYRSPFRRAKPAAASSAAVAEADLLSGAPAAPPPRATPSPSPAPSRPSAPPLRVSPAPRRPASTRPHVAVSPSALATAQSHKTAGNEHFKLGRFGEATAAYTRALDALPAAWLGRVPLLNNRAQARLRSGEEKAAAEDCAEAVGILLGNAGAAAGEADLPALEADSAALPAEVSALYAGGAPVDLKDQLGKALGRRAKALEALEKWTQARDDWERVLRAGDEAVMRGAGGAKMVSDGVARCRKVLDPTPAPAPRPASSAAPAARAPSAAKPRSPAPPVQGSGDAVRALQAQQAVQAAEDDARHALKDAVDARIASWKGGKEMNLRALIASLDMVLWPELGWKTVGMHELISEGQLKVRYVRAIAKVHPDKLNANNTTVEQRMIAALVFAALNDAWNGMK
ncbi:auxilin-like clathrin-binding protein required for normal clathrin function [Rhodotorula kratochvilovae]